MSRRAVMRWVTVMGSPAATWSNSFAITCSKCTTDASTSASARASAASWKGSDLATLPMTETRPFMYSRNSRTAPCAVPSVPDAIAAENMMPNIIW
ncbi:unannotated protein [freshwater metagenome]|uniref:Unannotated protein n=1 Tax=freshwater metagenome TaxID=449393 RepID=A0A6J7LE46_9ZZZZ